MVLPAAAAMRARLLDRKNAVLHAHAAVALTGAAGAQLAVGGTRTLALRAGGQCRHVDFPVDAEHGFLEIEFEHITQIRAATRAPAAATHAEDIGKNIAENVADVAIETAATPHAGLECSVTMLVVQRTFLRIAEDFVSLLGFLEVRLAILVVGIAIRVMLHRQATECLLQFIVRSSALDAENFVVATFFHLRLTCFSHAILNAPVGHKPHHRHGRIQHTGQPRVQKRQRDRGRIRRQSTPCP